MERFDVEIILDKGIQSEEELSDDELLIYSVAYFESIADMEGWDHFYTYEMRLYPALQIMLRLAGDICSLNVLKAYENHFIELGVKFTSTEIDGFLSTATNEYLASCPDWREEFSKLGQMRWNLISSYFKAEGIEIKT